MSSIFERPVRPYIALETYQATANPFVIGAGRIGASKLRPAGTSIVWTDWTHKVLNIDAERGGTVVDIAHRNEVGTLSVTLRDLSLDIENPEFVAGQRIRLQHVNGAQRRSIFTGEIREIDVRQLRMGAGRRPVSVLQLVATDAVRDHNEVTRYGVLPDTGTETLAARIDRLSRTASKPIAAPTEAIGGLLGRTVYESSISNHLDIACNTVGAFWYVDGDGITRVRRRRMTPTWREISRNQVYAPRPTTYVGSEWACAVGFMNVSGGWVGGQAAGNTTAYIFAGLSHRAYAAGEKVTLSVRYQVPASPAAAYVCVLPHFRVGNTYWRGGYQVTRPVVVGREEHVVIQWITGAAIPANSLDIAVVSSNAAGTGFATVPAGFAMRATEALIEDGWTKGTFYDGSTDAQGLLSRTRWAGAVNASPSILEVPANITTLAERSDEFPGYPFPAGTLKLIRYGAARGSRVTYNGLDYDNHGAQDDPDNPGTWIADDQTFIGPRRASSILRYGLRVATLPTNLPSLPGNINDADPSNLLAPYDGDTIAIQTVVWNAQEDVTRVPDLDVGSYIELPLIGDMSTAPWRSYIVGGIRHTITPNRWLIELRLIGVTRDV